jgi:small nuclear ribonucleoprotein (snRNP)-like protein
VHLRGGRVVTGDFTCLDPQGNLILSNACELVPNGDKQLTTERPMGMVLVLKNQQEKVLMQVRSWKQH